MKFIVDKDTIWEDMGKVTVHNYPASNSTYGYITRTYREYKKGVHGCKEVEGPAVYFYDMLPHQITFAIIIAQIQAALSESLPHDKRLKIIK